MIKWRYCLDELPDKDEVIIRMTRRNREDRDETDQFDSYPYFAVEYVKQYYSEIEQFKLAHAQMKLEGIDFDYWWVYAKELNWPEEILKKHTFSKRVPYEWEKNLV